jgi:hypothetical protein
VKKYQNWQTLKFFKKNTLIFHHFGGNYPENKTVVVSKEQCVKSPCKATMCRCSIKSNVYIGNSMEHLQA